MSTKTCSRCKVDRPLSEFYAYKRAKDGLLSHCKKCARKYTTEWRNKKGLDVVAATAREAIRSLRHEALLHLGGACPCGVSDFRVLEIDHVHGGGRREKRDSKKYMGTYYREIISGARDEELQVLCSNCHLLKTRYPDDCIPGSWRL